MKYSVIMTAERRDDVYAGPLCQDHEPQWWVHAHGDKSDEVSQAPIIFDCKLFPAGTLITVEIPVCPLCECDVQMCDCGYDWKTWAEQTYG